MRRVTTEPAEASLPEPASPAEPAPLTKIVSWNLLHLMGASFHDVVRLIRQEHPDILLMQEATPMMDALPAEVGGFYVRNPLPGRRHGLATWSRTEPIESTVILPLQRGAMFDRVSQISFLEGFAVANVHLSHGQVLNRRQLRRIAEALAPRAAVVMGDFNLVGPALLPGFRDVGPRNPTHIAGSVVPFRLDRCLIRGLACVEARTLVRGASDHRPIAVRLEPAPARRPGVFSRRPGEEGRRTPLRRAASRLKAFANS